MLFLLFLCLSYSLKLEKIPKTNNPPDKFYIPGLVFDPVLSRIIYFGMKNVERDIYENTLYTFNLINLTWDKITPESEFIPSPLGSPFLYLRSDRILLSIFGCNDQGYISDIFAYNLTSNMWSTLNMFQVPGRSYFSATSFVHDDRELIAFFGGYTKTGVSNELYLFDTWDQEFTLMPNNGHSIIPGSSQSIAYLDRKLYLFGTEGENALKSESMYNYAFKIYDLDTQSWTVNYTSNTNKTLELVCHNLISVNETLYILGGYYSKYGTGNQEIFEVNLRDFSTLSIPRNDTYSYFRGYTTVVQYNNSLIISGGRSNYENSNEVFQIFLSPYSLRVLSKETLSPQSRKNSAMFLFSSYIYMFAGSTATSFLNDMWRYSIDESKWEAVSPLGDVPSPREKIYFTDYFDLGIFIFGGKADGVYSDMYFYSHASEYWSLLKYTGDLPGPRHSGCTVMWENFIILIGGKKERGVTDEIFLLDPYKQVSHKVTWSGSNTVKLTNHVCRSLESTESSFKVYVFGGESSELVQSLYSYVIQIWVKNGVYYSTQIERIQKTDLSLNIGESQLVSYENTTLVFFGSAWAQQLSNSIIKIDHSSGSYNVIQFPFYVSGHSLVHYNQSIYMFGGCVSNSLVFFKHCYSNTLYKLDFEDSDKIKLPCSPAMLSPNCEFCPEGTYMNRYKKCVPCGPGKYSKMIGATSTLSCIPCEYGTFNENSISNSCKHCPGNRICYIGSNEPKYSIQDTVYSSVQPKVFTRNYNSINKYTGYAAIGISCLIFLSFLGLNQFKNLYLKVDLFSSQHSNSLNEPIIYRKTSIGGLFSLFFFGFCLAAVPPMIDSYINDNIYEQKALVPLVTIEKLITSSFLIVTVDLQYYGGLCVESDTCISLILISDDNINYKNRSISCTKLPNACSIKLNYTDCHISGLSLISIVSYEHESYCSIISVNVTSDSSIPSEVSSYVFNLKPESNNKVFKGSTPSKFNFEITPSVFYSESGKWPRELTGYHVSKYGSSTIGTTVEQKYIVINPLLNVEVSLIVSNSALVTERKLIYDLMMFSSSVMGLVFGAMGVFGMLMAYSESLSEVISKKSKSINNIKKLKNYRNDLQANFKGIDKLEPEIDVLNFTFEDTDKGMQTLSYD